MAICLENFNKISLKEQIIAPLNEFSPNNNTSLRNATVSNYLNTAAVSIEYDLHFNPSVFLAAFRRIVISNRL